MLYSLLSISVKIILRLKMKQRRSSKNTRAGLQKELKSKTNFRIMGKWNLFSGYLICNNLRMVIRNQYKL